MSGQRKRLQPYYAALDSYGVEIVAERTTKHTHVTGRYKGEPVICTIPVSPSVSGGIHRFRRDIRHAVAEIDARKASGS
jgi:hypothetical protein